MIEWMMQNKEWIFSGAGIAILASIISFLRNRLKKGREKNDDNLNQSIKVGGSISQSNIIIGSGNELIDSNRRTNTNLSELEKELLIAAADDGQINVLYTEQTGDWIRAGRKNFVQQSDPAIAARYLNALYNLCELDYAVKKSDKVFGLTGPGFAIARELVSKGNK